jgi:hypothetical protein
LFKKGVGHPPFILTSQDEEKVFSEKKLFYFLEHAYVKKKEKTCLSSNPG